MRVRAGLLAVLLVLAVVPPVFAYGGMPVYPGQSNSTAIRAVRSYYGPQLGNAAGDKMAKAVEAMDTDAYSAAAGGSMPADADVAFMGATGWECLPLAGTIAGIGAYAGYLFGQWYARTTNPQWMKKVPGKQWRFDIQPGDTYGRVWLPMETDGDANGNLAAYGYTNIVQTRIQASEPETFTVNNMNNYDTNLNWHWELFDSSSANVQSTGCGTFNAWSFFYDDWFPDLACSQSNSQVGDDRSEGRYDGVFDAQSADTQYPGGPTGFSHFYKLTGGEFRVERFLQTHYNGAPYGPTFYESNVGDSTPKAVTPSNLLNIIQNLPPDEKLIPFVPSPDPKVFPTAPELPGPRPTLTSATPAPGTRTFVEQPDGTFKPQSWPASAGPGVDPNYQPYVAQPDDNPTATPFPTTTPFSPAPDAVTPPSGPPSVPPDATPYPSPTPQPTATPTDYEPPTGTDFVSHVIQLLSTHAPFDALAAPTLSASDADLYFVSWHAGGADYVYDGQDVSQRFDLNFLKPFIDAAVTIGIGAMAIWTVVNI